MIRQCTRFALIPLLAVGLTGWASAEPQGRRDRDDRRDSDDYRFSGDQAYRDGLERGRSDRSNNRRRDARSSQWERGDSRYRDAYRNGYEAGYNSAGGAWGRGDDGYRGDRGYGGYNDRRGGNQAYQVGFQDGRLDGQNDRYTGHSFRPTTRGNYKHGDRGYSSGFGDKNGYKQQYRSGYLQGYEQGYRR